MMNAGEHTPPAAGSTRPAKPGARSGGAADRARQDIGRLPERPARYTAQSTHDRSTRITCKTLTAALAGSAALVATLALPAAAQASVAGSSRAAAATTIKPAYSKNLAGYAVTQSGLTGSPYTSVQATFTLPTITKVSSSSYAFAYYWAAIGAPGNAAVAGVEEEMVYGSVSYQAFAEFGTRFIPLQVTVNPGDTITLLVSGSDTQQWFASVGDQATGGAGVGDTQSDDFSQYAAEVGELRPANPIGPGYLPLAATTPVAFDHATYTTAGGTYPFLTVPRGGGVLCWDMRNTAGTQTIAATSQPDSDHDGFTIQDGAATPPPPKS